MRRLLKEGDRIRLKVRTIMGFKGECTVAEDQLSRSDGVRFWRDTDDRTWIPGDACDHEVVLVRKKKVPPTGP